MSLIRLKFVSLSLWLGSIVRSVPFPIAAFLASLLLVLSSQLRLFLPLTPVPVTGQTFVVMLLSIYWKCKSVVPVLLYLMEIAIGLPFGAHSTGGLLLFVGPTAGYLVGMLVQAYFTGWIAERATSVLGKFLAIFAVSLIQLGMGAAWLGTWVGFHHVLVKGFWPFLPGELWKCGVTTVAACRVKRL